MSARGSRRGRVLALGGCAVIAVTVAMAISGQSGSEPSDRGSPAPALDPSARGVGADDADTASARSEADADPRTVALQQLAVLRRPRAGGADAVPTRVRRQPLFRDGIVEFSAARAVRTMDGARAWMAPSSDGKAVCVLRAGAVACPPVEVLTSEGLTPAINARRGEPVRVWGIATDGVSSIMLTERSGRRSAVPFADNFFDVELDAWPHALSWIGPRGPRSLNLAEHEPPSAPR